MERMKGEFDGIIDTVSAPHDIKPYAGLIRVGGAYIVVGAPPSEFSVPPSLLINRRLTLAGSLIGGIEASG